ncbi:unnamed protein product [Vitrella brassicaformis CCMP3155]|uniref:Protein kinase domain-containing protein n=2 Tax=Vitrella brassicaformis TaxID=1169539 RepID=A0A0G4ESU1_VITBC|nr:unnamed protein product [Vitrella brassicaformis CCMP3155]|eukprot:CEM01476.1 unnamed protein product [Vitrella brassicaformis CCMP3155]
MAAAHTAGGPGGPQPPQPFPFPPTASPSPSTPLRVPLLGAHHGHQTAPADPQVARRVPASRLIPLSAPYLQHHQQQVAVVAAAHHRNAAAAAAAGRIGHYAAAHPGPPGPPGAVPAFGYRGPPHPLAHFPGGGAVLAPLPHSHHVYRGEPGSRSISRPRTPPASAPEWAPVRVDDLYYCDDPHKQSHYLSCLSVPIELTDYDLATNPYAAVLGAGAYARVIRLRHRTTKETVALKIMEIEHYVCRGLRGQLDREVQLHQRCDHRNVVRQHRWFHHCGHIFLVLEYVPNTLYRLIKTPENILQRLEEPFAVYIFMQLCAALHYLHTHNILHRDLKPENILVDNQYHVKLGDFGWSAELRPDESRQSICGTFIYMAPEVLQRQSQATWIDMWSLGCLLHEMVTGSPPFPPPASQTGDEQQAHAPPDPNQQLRAMMANIRDSTHMKCPDGMSSQCWDIVRRLLKVDPKRRMSPAEAVRHSWCEQYHEQWREYDPELFQDPVFTVDSEGDDKPPLFSGDSPLPPLNLSLALSLPAEPHPDRPPQPMDIDMDQSGEGEEEETPPVPTPTSPTHPHADADDRPLPLPVRSQSLSLVNNDLNHTTSLMRLTDNMDGMDGAASVPAHAPSHPLHALLPLGPSHQQQHHHRGGSMEDTTTANTGAEGEEQATSAHKLGQQRSQDDSHLSLARYDGPVVDGPDGRERAMGMGIVRSKTPPPGCVMVAKPAMLSRLLGPPMDTLDEQPEEDGDASADSDGEVAAADDMPAEPSTSFADGPAPAPPRDQEGQGEQGGEAEAPILPAAAPPPPRGEEASDDGFDVCEEPSSPPPAVVDSEASEAPSAITSSRAEHRAALVGSIVRLASSPLSSERADEEHEPAAGQEGEGDRAQVPEDSFWEDAEADADRGEEEEEAELAPPIPMPMPMPPTSTSPPSLSPPLSSQWLDHFQRQPRHDPLTFPPDRGLGSLSSVSLSVRKPLRLLSSLLHSRSSVAIDSDGAEGEAEPAGGYGGGYGGGAGVGVFRRGRRTEGPLRSMRMESGMIQWRSRSRDARAGAPPLADEHAAEIRLRTDKGPGKRSDHDDYAPSQAATSSLQPDQSSDIRHPLLAPSPSRPTLPPISPSIPIDLTPFSFLDSRPRGRASDGGESLRRSSSSGVSAADDSLGGRLSSRRSESWRWDEIKWSEGQSRSGGSSGMEGEEDSRGSEEGEGSGSSGYGYLVIRSEAESEESDSSAGSSVVTARRISPSPENPDRNEDNVQLIDDNAEGEEEDEALALDASTSAYPRLDAVEVPSEPLSHALPPSSTPMLPFPKGLSATPPAFLTSMPRPTEEDSGEAHWPSERRQRQQQPSRSKSPLRVLQFTRTDAESRTAVIISSPGKQSPAADGEGEGDSGDRAARADMKRGGSRAPRRRPVSPVPLLRVKKGLRSPPAKSPSPLSPRLLQRLKIPAEPKLQDKKSSRSKKAAPVVAPTPSLPLRDLHRSAARPLLSPPPQRPSAAPRSTGPPILATELRSKARRAPSPPLISPKKALTPRAPDVHSRRGTSPSKLRREQANERRQEGGGSGSGSGSLRSFSVAPRGRPQGQVPLFPDRVVIRRRVDQDTKGEGETTASADDRVCVLEGILRRRKTEGLTACVEGEGEGEESDTMPERGRAGTGRGDRVEIRTLTTADSLMDDGKNVAAAAAAGPGQQQVPLFPPTTPRDTTGAAAAAAAYRQNRPIWRQPPLLLPAFTPPLLPPRSTAVPAHRPFQTSFTAHQHLHQQQQHGEPPIPGGVDMMSRTMGSRAVGVTTAYRRVSQPPEKKAPGRKSDPETYDYEGLGRVIVGPFATVSGGGGGAGVVPARLMPMVDVRRSPTPIVIRTLPSATAVPSYPHQHQHHGGPGGPRQAPLPLPVRPGSVPPHLFNSVPPPSHPQPLPPYPYRYPMWASRGPP